MTSEIDQLAYEEKQADYFQCTRSEMLPFVPKACKRILDVGCAEGAFGETLKKVFGAEVWGVEPVKSAAAVAVKRIDRVFEGVFSPESGLPVGTFDCIFFNDVLEHMLAPEAALRYAGGLLAPGGVVVASIPNVRFFPVIWELAVHGRWDYHDCGILDKTHLRFFTKSSIRTMFESEEFTLQSICGINAYWGLPNVSTRLWRAYRLANAISLGSIDEMKFLQFVVVARPTKRN